MKTYSAAKKRSIALTFFLLLAPWQIAASVKADIVLQGVHEASLDLPRIYFALKREPSGPILGPHSDTEANYAFLDTGASGILLSHETADALKISVDPKAQFADVGVGGAELFGVSEPLYLGLAGLSTSNPGDSGSYKFVGQGRFQVRKTSADLLGEPLDIIGMPAMMGRIIVLHSGATNSMEYFAAEVKEPGDSTIPKVDVKVSLRFKKFINLKDPNNIPPLPTLAHNPVIDNVTITRKTKTSKGTWLFDTGATLSLISTKQANKLGLMDEKGNPTVKSEFSLPIGGIGNMVMIPGFEIDSLTIPAMSGQNLVFKNVRLGVQDIKYFDEEKGTTVTLDGVFGSNFLCASAKMDGLLPSDVSETMFDNIVLDMQKGTLGFDLKKNSKQPQ
jgi:hypothetical protein